MCVRAEFYDICHPRHLQELSPRTTRDLDYDLNPRQAAKPVKGSRRTPLSMTPSSLDVPVTDPRGF